MKNSYTLSVNGEEIKVAANNIKEAEEKTMEIWNKRHNNNKSLIHTDNPLVFILSMDHK